MGPTGMRPGAVSSDVVYVAAEIASCVWNGGEPMQGREFDLTMGVVYKTLNGGEEWFEIWRGENLARYIWIDLRDEGIHRIF